ncbi:uncharacterized protein LOC111191148 isoform X7 [Astyanax mexicanus]|uniref:uncharacterized protein LOC111191148 isoform X5 n=1 Tax=Astyanax mexicanus TaxID=7994 RepID=UPI0020CB40EA|nr:uncharacterized protein LOC111191148 isoform X5 [Astyanax mexicanus]XP_049327279.1 uncharacterized protein LOC111191148 isoform X6 [Astyanax mexicanus]XP_049327280.1 uncharacterized protein LOC111191148 isoform X7 [Astyanax mexicanus]
MSTLCFILLLFFLGKCRGETRFIYKTEDKEEKLECKTNKWQISTTSNNTIDLNCSVQCETGRTVELDDLENPSFCSKDKDSQSGSVCSLKVEESGYYSCVKSLDSGFLFPFKSSPNNVIQSYIIAVQNPALTIESGKRSSSLVNVAEGGSVTLNCSFNFTQGYNLNKFIVYWIKTVEQNSTCIYSFDYDQNKPTYGHHCDEPPDKFRFTYQSEGPFTHSIKISEVKSSDRGQYRCALQMDTSVKESKTAVNWKVIENVTLRVHNPTPPHSTDQPETPKIPETPNIPQGSTAVYVGVSMLLCVLLLAGVFVFIRKRRFLSAGPQTVQQQRDNKETLDADCSPYAVGRGDQEYDSIKSPSTTADPDHKQPSEPLDPYSVVRLNDLYDSSASENVQHPV